MVSLENDTNDVDHDLTIRRIAILLRAMPASTHRALLGQLSSQVKQEIAAELIGLGDVDSDELADVLSTMRDQLHAETDRMKSVESEIQDEIMIGRARVASKSVSSLRRSGDPKGSHQASSLLAQREQSSGEQSGQRPKQGSDSLDNNPEGADSKLSYYGADGRWQLRQEESSSDQSEDPSADVRDEERSPTIPISAILNSTSSDEFDTSTKPRFGRGKTFSDTDRVDRILGEISPEELGIALASVSTKQAFLALCGLPNEIAEQVIDMLPRRKARQVRSDMRRLGKLQLSEIDSAKAVVADIAVRTTLDREAA